MGRRLLAGGAAATTVALAVTTGMPGSALAEGRSDLAAVRQATAAYHDVGTAEAAGYSPFLDCFASPSGGMGQHYVDHDALDAVVESTRPEALVYEVRGDRLRLVGVEYIVPNSPEATADPPDLFGQRFHLNRALDVWVLHAWVWRSNPGGTFADWNRNVAPCPR